MIAAKGKWERRTAQPVRFNGNLSRNGERPVCGYRETGAWGNCGRLSLFSSDAADMGNRPETYARSGRFAGGLTR